MRRRNLIVAILVFTISLFYVCTVSFAYDYSKKIELENKIENDPEETRYYKDLYNLLEGSSEEVIVFLDGEEIDTYVSGIDKNYNNIAVKAETFYGEPYIPIRPLVEALDGEIDYDETSRTVKVYDLKYDLLEIKTNADKHDIQYIYVNNQKRWLSSPIKYKYWRLYVPVDLVDEYMVEEAKHFGNDDLSIVQILQDPVDVDGVVSKPELLPEGDTYDETQYVEIECDESADIYYTTDGDKPDKYSEEYDHPIKVDEDMTIRARAYKDGVWSREVSEEYEIDEQEKPREPRAHPDGDEFDYDETPIEITLYSVDCGRIYYTLDGDDPKYNKDDYVRDGEEIDIEESVTLKARVYKDGRWSNLLREEYEINEPERPEEPEADPDGGSYDQIQEVELTSTSGAEIYYTTDGSTPYMRPSGLATRYTEPIVVDEDMTIKARAYKNDSRSTIMVERYNIKEIEEPKFAPDEGTYKDEIEVFLYTNDNSEIYYTTDGSTPYKRPSGLATRYTEPIVVDEDMTIKARAYNNNTRSSIIQKTYNIKESEKPERPEAHPDGDEFDYDETPIEVTLYSEDCGRIYYTLDGDDPKYNKDDYVRDGEEIDIEESATLKARVYKDGRWSNLLREEYEINEPERLKEPEADPYGGSYDQIQEVELTSTPGAEIYYTTDGSTPYKRPSGLATRYTEPIVVDEDMIIKARAYNNNTRSSIMVEEYNITIDEDEDLLALAEKKYEDGEYNKAIEILKDLLKSDKENEDAIVLLANCYVRKGYVRTAKGKLEDFIRENSPDYKYPKAVNRYAELHIILHQNRKAIDLVTDILPQNSDKTYLYRTLTYARYKLGIEGIKVFIYGEEVEFSRYDNVDPIIVSGRTLVPVRALSEAMGAEVSWDDFTKKATIDLEDKTIELVEGSRIARVNGDKKVLDVPAQLYKERLVVPLRFVSENFDREVNWYQRGMARTISIIE